MALSGTLKKDFADYYRLQLEWTATQSTSNNTSTITAKLYLISLSSQSTISTSSDRRAWIDIEGTRSYSAYDPNKLDLAGNQKKLMHTYTRTVGHNSNGDLVCDFLGAIDWNLNINGYTGSTVTLTGTGTLNNIPQEPTYVAPKNVKITYPTTRTTFDNSFQIKWTSDPDPNGLALQYEIAYRNKSSNSWTYTALFTNNNSTKTYTFDTTNWVDSTTAQFAVRSRNSEGLYSSWQYTPDQTVKNEVPPEASTPLEPNSSGTYPPELNTRFSWALNGSGGQSAYIMEYRKAGTTAWTSTGFITSTRLYHDVPGNTLTAGQYEWRIGLKGSNGLSGPWSVYQQFEVLAPTTAPTILKPEVSAVVNNNLIEVEWQSVTGQEAYQLQLLEDTIIRFDETINSALPAGYITYGIEDGATYTVQVRTKSNGVWSPYSSRIITASVAKPDAAIIDPDSVTTTDEDRGSINVSYTPPPVKLNLLPSFTSGQWTGVTQGTHTTAWSTVDGTSDIEIRIAAKPGILYLASAVLNNGYELVLVTYDAGNAVQGFTSAGATADGQTVQNNIMTSSTTTSIVMRIVQDTGLADQPISNPMLSDQMVNGTYPPFEPGSDVGFTNPVYMEIHRRLYNSDEWVAIVSNIDLSIGGYEDLTIGSGLLYEYKIVTIGSNGLTNETAIFESQVRFEHAFLHDAENPSIFFRIQLEDAREEELDVEGEIQFFAGRRLPVREYGVHETHKLDIEWIIDSSQELNDLKEQVKKRRALLYRDNVGRRFYATTNGVKATDRQIIGHNMSMTLIETDYKEGVG